MANRVKVPIGTIKYQENKLRAVALSGCKKKKKKKKRGRKRPKR